MGTKEAFQGEEAAGGQAEWQNRVSSCGKQHKAPIVRAWSLRGEDAEIFKTITDFGSLLWTLDKCLTGFRQWIDRRIYPSPRSQWLHLQEEDISVVGGLGL